ncbi:hypothetical protein [Aurantiacibacter poecillastricola]|uniref:hypothetical protein n=1 Tax=Aurantiacibacter poecillastricola TaxID=3064385 RepID=UPI00273E7E72|nr:hypothetical protein [Aurantiacibacter sp. 219JJ12-13]MDP5261558.1 hypothetical protein [Aurantiacibacter sp. 219JJ12-13]
MTDETLQLIEWPDKAPTSASARRSGLTIPLRLKGAGSDAIPQAREVRVTGLKRAGDGDNGKDLTAFQVKAAPLILGREGDTMVGEVSLRLDRTMPPGQYVASLKIAGLQRDVIFDVVEDPSLRIRPSPLVIDVSKGGASEASVSFENRGNIELSIDVRGEYPLGLEEPLAADVTDTDVVLSVLTAALNRARGVLTDVGTLGVTMPDGSFTLAPGTARTCRIAVTPNAKLDPVRRYRAFIPLFASELEIAVVTAIKPEGDKPAPPKGGKT